MWTTTHHPGTWSKCINSRLSTTPHIDFVTHLPPKVANIELQSLHDISHTHWKIIYNLWPASSFLAVNMRAATQKFLPSIATMSRMNVLEHWDISTQTWRATCKILCCFSCFFKTSNHPKVINCQFAQLPIFPKQWCHVKNTWVGTKWFCWGHTFGNIHVRAPRFFRVFPIWHWQ